MKVKLVLVSLVSISSALVACNSGSSSAPATNYGEVVSTLKQKLVFSQQPLIILEDIPIVATEHGSSPIYKTMLSAGKFGESTDAGIEFGNAIYAYESANIINTKADFAYDVKAIDKYLIDEHANIANAYAIKYKTPGQNHDTDPTQIERTVSGLIILPKTQNIRGVVLYYHPTVFAKNQVPSCLALSSTAPDYCNQAADPADKIGFATFANLASIYASRGFAVVAPDYLGMGADWDNVHPYVAYPEANVLSGFNMFPALRQLLAKENIANDKTLPLMITGYSEGGGYALKASQMAQGDSANLLKDNHLELKITTPQEGAYSVKDQINFAFADLNDGVFNCSNKPDGSKFVCGESSAISVTSGLNLNDDVAQMNNWKIVSSMYAATAKSYLTSYVLAASMYYSFNNLSSAYNFAMNSQFWQAIPIVGTPNSDSLYNLFSPKGYQYTDKQIRDSLFAHIMSLKDDKNELNYNNPTPYNLTFYAQGSKDNANVELASFAPNPLHLPKSAYGQNNQGTIYINKGIETNPLFIDLIDKASTYNWTTNSPINFINMRYDSAVTVINVEQAYSCMKYGKSFAGDKNTVASGADCTTKASASNLIERTTINNGQLVNDLLLLNSIAMTQRNMFSGNAVSHYWSAPEIRSLSKEVNSALKTKGLGFPMDHSDMFVLGNIAALCTFENMLATNSNNSKCPDLTQK